MRIGTIFLVTLLLCFANISAQKNFDKNGRPGLETIKPSHLRSHLAFLASSELEGRETSYRGQKVAAQYIAAVFGKLGLSPGGENGTFFQHFDLNVRRPGDQSSITMAGPKGTKRFHFRKDFLGTALRETTFTARVMFAGDQNMHFSSEQEAALAGNVAVVFAARRNQPGDTSRTQRRSGGRFFRNAAAALIVINEAESGSIEQQARQFANAIEKGQMTLRDAPQPPRFQAPLAFLVSQEVGATILAPLGMEKLRAAGSSDSAFSPIPLAGISVTIDLKTSTDVKTSENVIGILEGSDPILKNEFVVFTAHYDHIGVSASDGAIYHGADDDGSGTAAILELAEAFVLNPVKPKRSIVFMTVSGEEKGLLGSDYYTRHPVVPLDKTIANINIDMIGRIDKKFSELKKTEYVYVIGSDKISTELDSLLKAANKETVNITLDYTYNDDNDPQQFYRRSDHYNFAKNGIPIVFFFTGIHEDYHRPTDTVDKIMFDKTAMIGRLAFATGWKIANFKRMLRKDGKPGVYSTQ